MLLVNLYISRFLLQFTSHQLLECFMMLMIFEFFVHILSIELTRLRITFSSCSTSDKSLILISLNALINSLTKTLSLLLFLTIVCFLAWICSPKIGIVIVNRAWSEVSLYSRWIVWLLNSFDLNHKNIRSSTKFISWLLSEYLVRTWLV